MSLAQNSHAAAVQPLRTPPAVRRNWTAYGLPETGWVMATDKRLCTNCPEPAQSPCVTACTTSHHLPAEARANLGVCAHCEPAFCEEACPTDAIGHTAQGVVEVDQELCIGCRFCADACPNDALLFVDGYEVPTPSHSLPGYTAGLPTGVLPNTVAKCTLCSGRILDGEMPVCAVACPEGAIWVGNLDRDTATNGRQVLRLSDLIAQHQVKPVPPGRRILELT